MSSVKKYSLQSSSKKVDNGDKTEVFTDDQLFSEGRLAGNMIVLDQIYDNFQHERVEEVRKLQPPYVPRLTDAEIGKLLQYEKNYTESQLELANEELLKFVRIVAGLSFTNEDQLVKISSRDTGGLNDIFQGGSQPVIQQAPYSSGTVGPIAPGTPGPALLGVAPSTPAPTTGPPATAPPPGTAPPTGPFTGTMTTTTTYNTIPKNIYDLSRDPRYASQIKDYISRNRQYSNLRWLESPGVMGIVKLTPVMEACMELAYSVIISEYTDFSSATKEIFIKDQEMSIWFATLTSHYIMLKRFEGGARNQLDSNYLRQQMQIQNVLQKIKGLKYDKYTERFIDPRKKKDSYRDIRSSKYPRIF